MWLSSTFSTYLSLYHHKYAELTTCWKAYLSHLNQVGEHDNSKTVLLPDHSPEITDWWGSWTYIGRKKEYQISEENQLVIYLINTCILPGWIDFSTIWSRNICFYYSTNNSTQLMILSCDFIILNSKYIYKLQK